METLTEENLIETENSKIQINGSDLQIEKSNGLENSSIRSLLEKPN